MLDDTSRAVETNATYRFRLSSAIQDNSNISFVLPGFTLSEIKRVWVYHILPCQSKYPNFECKNVICDINPTGNIIVNDDRVDIKLNTTLDKFELYELLLEDVQTPIDEQHRNGV